MDDEPSAHAVLKTLLAESADIDLVACFTQPKAALDILSTERFDLLFLDITMPGLSGMDLLRTLSNPPTTILLTAHAEHALGAFELGVSDYLLKPVSKARLNRSLENVRPLLRARLVHPDALSRAIAIKIGNAHRLIDPAHIIRVEAAGNFSLLVLEQEQILASEPLKDMEQRLAVFGFLRPHKSHLINIAEIEALDLQTLRLRGGASVPVGRAYRTAVAERLGL